MPCWAVPASSIGFLFDVISPYAYLAWCRIHELAARHGRSVDPQPVLFAAMLDAWGQRGPAEIAPKRLYTFKHVVRLAADYGVSIAPPPSHPFNPLLALRVATAARAAPQARAVLDALFAAVWGGGPGTDNPERLVAWLDARGLDGAAWVSAAGTPAIKQQLRETTDAAIARGAFGVPTFDVDGELFWGQDALGHVEGWLRGEDPAAAVAERWSTITPTATRPGGQ
jgi:2-hydroxychromene-2-carboxylate isomerase